MQWRSARPSAFPWAGSPRRFWLLEIPGCSSLVAFSRWAGADVCPHCGGPVLWLRRAPRATPVTGSGKLMSFPVSIFDYNGVLVDDEAVHLAAFRDALLPHGVHVSESEYWDRYIGFDDREGFAAMLSDAGRPAPAALVEELVRAKQPLYLERARRELKGFEGARELVLRQAETGPVLVVSGALRSEIALGLEWLGVAN